MITIEKESLGKTISKHYPHMDSVWCEDYANKILIETDIRLEKNVKQWMNGEVLEDLWIGKYCIGAIMSIRGNEDFLSALDAMNLYLKDEEKGELKIWRTKK